MRLLKDDFDENDEYLLDTARREKFNLGTDMSDIAVRLSMRMPITVSFRLMSLVGDYSFSDSFDGRDAGRFFEVLKRLCRMTMDEAVDADGGELRNFHFAEVNRNLRAALRKVSGGKKIGDAPYFQFGLYTDKSARAGRSSGVKAPRVFCVLGYRGVIYPVLYDPYHEMYKC